MHLKLCNYSCRFFFYKFITISIYTNLFTWFVWWFWILLSPLHYVYNIFMVCNKILFSILTRSSFLSPYYLSLVIQPLNGIINGNAFIVIDLELTCLVLPLSSYLLILLLLWTKCFILHPKEPVMLNKIWWVSQKETLSFGKKLNKNFFEILNPVFRIIQLYEPS